MNLFNKLDPSVQKQYKVRMAIALAVLAVAILFTTYIFTIGEYKKLPFVGSISEKEATIQSKVENSTETRETTEYGTIVK